MIESPDCTDTCTHTHTTDLWAYAAHDYGFPIHISIPNCIQLAAYATLSPLPPVIYTLY